MRDISFFYFCIVTCFEYIMINPCQASTVITDTTTYLVVNNIANFGDYGGVTIVTMRYIFTYLLRSRYS